MLARLTQNRAPFDNHAVPTRPAGACDAADRRFPATVAEVSRDAPWDAGSIVVLRFLRPDGSIGQRHPLRVLADDGDTLLGWLPEGTEIIGSGPADGRRLRDVPLEQRFRVPRRSFRDRWRDCSTLRLVSERSWSSVWWFFESDGTFRNWYVNLEIPLGRTACGIDRIDGVLDLVVAPDRDLRWKDEDEAAAAVRAGRLTSAQLAALRAEGERLAALADARAFPFDGTWTDFRPDPSWQSPALPGGGSGQDEDEEREQTCRHGGADHRVARQIAGEHLAVQVLPPDHAEDGADDAEECAEAAGERIADQDDHSAGEGQQGGGDERLGI